MEEKKMVILRNEAVELDQAHHCEFVLSLSPLWHQEILLSPNGSPHTGECAPFDSPRSTPAPTTRSIGQTEDKAPPSVSFRQAVQTHAVLEEITPGTKATRAASITKGTIPKEVLEKRTRETPPGTRAPSITKGTISKEAKATAETRQVNSAPTTA
jgi:hypothetical protein